MNGSDLDPPGAPPATPVVGVAQPLATLADQRPALDPARLNVRAEKAARALLREGESANTRASYASAMRYWAAWYAARFGAVLRLPVPVPVVIQFIVDHAARKVDRDLEAGGFECGRCPLAGRLNVGIEISPEIGSEN